MCARNDFDVRRLGKLTMARAHFPMPHHPKVLPEEFEPGAPTVEPDEGPVPALIPDVPEHDRVVDSAASQIRPAQRTRRQVEVAG
jgi:hypothetical protein